ncbi:2-octaprenyl-3-methyl-6-methoxy-1,4-benzoquinol hydroxylase [Vibrio sp.]|nr:2-octaprenyl-3-methyl-6-methoxy-1,4-benzoquinol hydroxylase [Vibrio sp.]
MKEHQIVIVGGGMVGAATALGFAQQGLDVAIVENKIPLPYEPEQKVDLRISAISMATVNLLQDLGIWSTLESMRLCPYRRLETWEHPECRTRFHSDDIGEEQLGYMVENRILQLALWEHMQKLPSLSLYCPDSLQDIIDDRQSDAVIVSLDSGEKIRTQWVIGADGANSKVRQLSGIGVTAWDYRQHCMLINIETESDQQDITWQQFFPSGPRSFLPFVGHQGSLVWYDSPNRIKQLMAMNNSQLKREIESSFPDELGAFTVLDKGSFPLTRRHAQTYYKGRVIIIGDAAHTINPLAGQGVNLGFKDVSVLLEESRKAGDVSENVARHYYRRRVVDNLAMQSGMDFFYKTFSNNLPPLKFARNALLKLAESSGPVKKEVLKYAIGLK